VLHQLRFPLRIQFPPRSLFEFSDPSDRPVTLKKEKDSLSTTVDVRKQKWNQCS
jgi:hypothetical protein